MFEAFIGYNSGYYENDKRDKEKFLYAYAGSDPPDADRAYYVCSSKTAAETACWFSSRSEDEQDRAEAIHS
jgi:hypothetical protein